MAAQRILVPIDFSDCSRLLVAEAGRLAQKLDASITLLHVVHPPDGLPGDVAIDPGQDGHPTTVAAHLVESAHERLPVYASMVQRLGVPVATLIDQGDIPARILRHQADGHHDMIIMGTHGRRGLARMVMGSVAEAVLRDSVVPVMTVRTEHRPDCQARSCDWCASHITPADLDAGIELDG
ncbi:MAG: universal stress protein [Alphaproteobacteria bacterium]|nr:universal stress protein [Alphaproteobacteria bacterium]